MAENAWYGINIKYCVKSDIKVFNPQFLLSENRGFVVPQNIPDSIDLCFKANQHYARTDEFKDKNGNYKTPINSGFEYLEALKLTALAGLYVAGRFAWEFFDSKALDNAKNFRTFAQSSLLIVAVYALAVLPKNLYERKIDIFQKKRVMGVYVGNNAASQKLYERIADKALVADNQKKQQLTEDYMKLKRTKNQVPDFIKNYQK